MNSRNRELAPSPLQVQSRQGKEARWPSLAIETHSFVGPAIQPPSEDQFARDKLALSRPKRDMVRSMKHRLAKGEVPHHEMNHVLGWINFANHVDRSNQTLPRSGPSVRPWRISFRKICLALDMVKEGNKPEEIIRSLGISRSSYYRAKRSKYISENLRSLYLQREDIEKACQLIESGEIQEALTLVQNKSSKL